MSAKNKLEVTSDQLLDLLAQRHEKDVFVSECKNGPTWVTGMRRLDAWVLLTTWKPWTTIGYEVKVSRSDFLSDEKWSEYLPYCHLFYFVSPPNVIKVSDLPPGCGLLWCGPNVTRLHQKIAATRREPDLSELTLLMSYVLMNRYQQWNQLAHTGYSRSIEHVEYLRKEVEAADERKDLASFVNSKVYLARHEAREQVKEARKLIVDIWEFQNWLEERGLKWNPSLNSWEWDGGISGVKSQIKKLAGMVDEGLTHSMRHLAKRMIESADEIDRTVNNG